MFFFFFITNLVLNDSSREVLFPFPASELESTPLLPPLPFCSWFTDIRILFESASWEFALCRRSANNRKWQSKRCYFLGSRDLYLFQEVGKLELGSSNHKFILIWTGRVRIEHKSFPLFYEQEVVRTNSGFPTSWKRHSQKFH